MPGKFWPAPFYTLPADQAFVIGMPFRWSGRDYKPGEAFDRAEATLRQLAMLYDGRRLTAAPKPTPAADAAQDEADEDDERTGAAETVASDRSGLEAGGRQAHGERKPRKRGPRSRTALAR